MSNTPILGEIDVLKVVYGDENVNFNESLKRLNVVVEQDLTVRLEIPNEYPATSPPVIVEPVEKDLDSLISQLFQPGDQILLQLIEAIREKTAESRNETRNEKLKRQVGGRKEQPLPISSDKHVQISVKMEVEAELDLKFITGETITANKSRFIGHAAVCKTPKEALELLNLVRCSKYAKATHNIWAYRLADGKANNDDDGETAAGGRLAELLQLAKVQDILVVVSRYYGKLFQWIRPERAPSPKMYTNKLVCRWNQCWPAAI